MSQHDYNSYYTTAYKPRVIGITPLQYEPPNTDSVRPVLLSNSKQFTCCIQWYEMAAISVSIWQFQAEWLQHRPHSQLPLQRRRRMQPMINFFVVMMSLDCRTTEDAFVWRAFQKRRRPRFEPFSGWRYIVLDVAFLVVRKQWQRPRMSSRLVAVDQDDTGRNGGSNGHCVGKKEDWVNV